MVAVALLWSDGRPSPRSSGQWGIYVPALSWHGGYGPNIDGIEVLANGRILHLSISPQYAVHTFELSSGTPPRYGTPGLTGWQWGCMFIPPPV
jgi:hypothetical protein